MRIRQRAATVSVGVGIFLLIIKFAAYYLTGSNAILSDALESIVNVVASSFALYAILRSARPPDKDYPYGYGKIELFSAGFEGALVIVAGLVGLVIASAPQVFIKGTSGIFVEALAMKLGAAMAHVDSLGVAALALNRGDPIELGDLNGTLETFPIGAEGDQQAGSQAGASSWQTTKDGGVGMGVHGGLDLVI